MGTVAFNATLKTGRSSFWELIRGSSAEAPGMGTSTDTIWTSLSRTLMDAQVWDSLSQSMQCFLCSKAKTIITGQIRQGSGRTAKPRAAGPGMLLPLPGKEKKRWQSQLPEIPGCVEESFQPSHSLPAMQRSTQKGDRRVWWLSMALHPRGLQLVYPGAPGSGTCGASFHNVNRILGKTTCHCMKVKKIWVKSGL